MPLFKSSKSLPYRELGNYEPPQEPAVSGLLFFSPGIRVCDKIVINIKIGMITDSTASWEGCDRLGDHALG